MPMEHKLMALAWNSIADGIIATDTQGLVADINQAALELIGIQRHEAIGQPLDIVFFLFDEISGTPIQKIWETSLTRLQTIGLSRNIKLQGRTATYYLSAKFSPIQEPGQPPQGIVVVFRDITRIRQNEEQLHLYKMAMEQSPFSVVITDTHNRIVYVNQEFIDLTGYQLEEVLGKNPGILRSGSTPKKTYLNMWDTITAGQVWQGEFYNRKKNGEFYWEKAIVAPITSADGTINHYLAIKEDVTTQKAMEEELNRTRGKAESNLKKSQYYMEQLEAARREADDANRAKSAFLANMSHEIRTPLNGMIGMIELISLTDLTPEQQEHLDIIRTCGDNLLNVINNVLDFSKIESGRMEVHWADVDLQDWFQRCLSVHKAQASKKDIDLLAVLDPQLPDHVRGDANLLQQVMNNFIGNAVKFTETGYVKVTMDYAGEDQSHIWAEIKVEDTGIGIPESQLPRLFESFTQLDGSIARRFGGTGLGLNISRQLVELMGGTIQATSVEGKGTTFTVNLPFRKAEEQAVKVKEAEAPATAEEALQRPIILLAEDDRINQIVLRSLLELKGYQVHCVNDGQEAVAAWETNPPDLVLMDIQMPVMDGLQATAAIRAKESDNTGRTPIVAITAYAIHGDRERFLSLGMDDYLPKPIDMEQLYSVLDNMLTHGKRGSLAFVEGQPHAAGGHQEPLMAEQLKAEVVEGFIPEMFSLLDRMNQELSGGNIEQVERLAHQIKKRAVTVGELDIKNQAFKVEIASRKNNELEVHGAYHALKKSFESYVAFAGQQ